MLFARTLTKIIYSFFKLTLSMTFIENELEAFLCISIEMSLEDYVYGN